MQSTQGAPGPGSDRTAGGWIWAVRSFGWCPGAGAPPVLQAAMTSGTANTVDALAEACAAGTFFCELSCIYNKVHGMISRQESA